MSYVCKYIICIFPWNIFPIFRCIPTLSSHLVADCFQMEKLFMGPKTSWKRKRITNRVLRGIHHLVAQPGDLTMGFLWGLGMSTEISGVKCPPPKRWTWVVHHQASFIHPRQFTLTLWAPIFNPKRWPSLPPPSVAVVPKQSAAVASWDWRGNAFEQANLGRRTLDGTKKTRRTTCDVFFKWLLMVTCWILMGRTTSCMGTYCLIIHL